MALSPARFLLSAFLISAFSLKPAGRPARLFVFRVYEAPVLNEIFEF
jgi:hypothetical protein